MTDAGGPAELPRRVEELWERFRPRIVERVDRLEEAVVALLSGRLDSEQRRLAEREAHKLAGSVGTFGYADASRFARRIEQALEGDRALEANDALHLSEWVLALRTHLDRPPSASVPDRSRPQLLLLTTDADLAERISMEAGARGYEVHRTEDESSTRATLTEIEPAAVIVDLPIAGMRDPFALLEEVAAAPSRPRVVVLAHSDNFAERVEAVRRGGTAYLRKPAAPLEVVDAVERSLRRGATAGCSVLVVDDDPHVLQLVATVLGGRGMHVQGVPDASSFWRALGLAAPDVVVLDVDMPDLNGVELCRAIRADPRWTGLPVLFLSGRTDAQSVEAIFSAGADDFVAKPVVGPELVNRIENRLARIGAREGVRERASPGGLPGRKEGRDALQRLLHLAGRAGAEAAIGRVAVRNLEEISQTLGPGTGEEALERVASVLQSAVEPGDVVGWWGGGDFALGWFAADSGWVSARLERVREQFSADRISADEEEVGIEIAAGIAAFPADGEGLDVLLRAAEGALELAGQAAADRSIRSAEAEADGLVELLDVVVVEDDAVVAELLLHALAVQGYTSRWIADGDAALQLLGGPRPSVRARVALLDVDLPGRDGLSVLRELSKQRVTGRTRVIMLTVRSTEREVLTALELGAADHVAKPFSVPVLLRRVRALLERA